MGIKGLFKLIQKLAPNAVRKTTLNEFAGKTVAVDASIYVYQLIMLGKHIKNSRLEDINHIQGFLFRTIAMLEAGVLPIYVFDGCPPAIKSHVMEKRKELKKKQASKAALDPTHVHCVVSNNLIVEIQELLQLLGIPQIHAKSEAEASAAKMALNSTHNTTAVISEDLDTLAFGAPMLLKGLTLGVGNKPATLTVVKLADVLSGLKITMSQFIDLCILCGSDYTKETLKGIGPIRALQLIRLHLTIEGIIKALGITPPDGFTYREARQEFMHPVSSTTITQRGRLNIHQLQAFLLAKGIDVKKINNAVARLQVIKN